MGIVEGLKLRRSVYGIGKTLPVDEQAVVKLVEDATALVPDAFDMKSQRVVLALGEKQDKLWDAIYDAFGGIIAEPAPKAGEDISLRVRVER